MNDDDLEWLSMPTVSLRTKRERPPGPDADKPTVKVGSLKYGDIFRRVRGYTTAPYTYMVFKRKQGKRVAGLEVVTTHENRNLSVRHGSIRPYRAMINMTDDVIVEDTGIPENIYEALSRTT